MIRFAILFLISFPLLSFAQEEDRSRDSIQSKSMWYVNARSFFMGTINKDELPDYYALAAGLRMGYESIEFKNFKVGVSGSFTYNLFSSDFSIPDPPDRRLNRYEVALFDVTDSAGTRHIERLEELYIRYRVHKSFLSAGKLRKSTPFINAQDGRMFPTLVQGFWVELNEVKNLKIETGWITHVSARSVARWYKVRNSIGLYSSGVNADGAPADYAGNITSDGIGIVGLTYGRESLSLSFWNTWIENIANTAMMKLEDSYYLKSSQLYGGLQYTNQHALKNGGSEERTKTYMIPGTYSNIVSVRIGMRRNRMDVNVNGTFITGNGRYLMPREWGRDPFYTFLPRERNEGSGEVKAVAVNLKYEIPAIRLSVFLGAGHYDLADVGDYDQNKYAMPSYNQLNLETRYNFAGILKGANVEILYVYKQGNDYGDFRNQLNKVNMSNFNVVFNYSIRSHSRG